MTTFAASLFGSDRDLAFAAQVDLGDLDLTGDFGAAIPATLDARIAERIRRARDLGDYTEGGVVDAREAAAFAYGYVKQRWIKARRAGGKIPDSDVLKIAGIAAQFATAAGEPTEEAAHDRALKVGGGAEIEAVKGKLIGVFTAVSPAYAILRKVSAAGTDAESARRARAVAVLHHAAGVYTAAGFPGVATYMQAAADASSKAAREAATAAAVDAGQKGNVITATAEGAKAAVAAVANTLVEAPAAIAAGVAQKDLAGGLNVAAASVQEAKTAVGQNMAAAKVAAGQLKAAGVDAVEKKLNAVVTIAQEAGVAARAGAADKAADLRARGAEADSALRQTIATVKAYGTKAEAAAAAKVGEKYDAAIVAAKAAQKTIAVGTATAIEAAKTGIKLDAAKLSAGARDLVASVRGDGGCDLLPAPAAFVCRNSGKLSASIKVAAVVLPLLLLASQFVGAKVKAAVAPKVLPYLLPGGKVAAAANVARQLTVKNGGPDGYDAT